jgi:hypothetical protein
MGLFGDTPFTEKDRKRSIQCRGDATCRMVPLGMAIETQVQLKPSSLNRIVLYSVKNTSMLSVDQIKLSGG